MRCLSVSAAPEDFGLGFWAKAGLGFGADTPHVLT